MTALPAAKQEYPVKLMRILLQHRVRYRPKAPLPLCYSPDDLVFAILAMDDLSGKVAQALVLKMVLQKLAQRFETGARTHLLVENCTTTTKQLM